MNTHIDLHTMLIIRQMRSIKNKHTYLIFQLAKRFSHRTWIPF
jgi:hypothetical protein